MDEGLHMVNITQAIMNVCMWLLLGLILWNLVIDDRKITVLEDAVNQDPIQTCTILALNRG